MSLACSKSVAIHRLISVHFSGSKRKEISWDEVLKQEEPRKTYTPFLLHGHKNMINL